MTADATSLSMNPPISHLGRIAYIPHEDIGNAYTERMRELLSGFGAVERFAGIKTLLRGLPGTLRCYDAIIVNWQENAIVKFHSGRISLKGVAKLFVKTLLMRIFTKRLIVVHHNNYPHGTRAGSERAARNLVDAYEILFDVVLTHSGATVGMGRLYCPHPLYRSEPEPSETADAILPDNYFLAFGRIVAYKKLDVLIQNFPPLKLLVVAGSVGDSAYARLLAGMKRWNFIFQPGHLSESEAQRLVRSARGVVIANADEDVVVSGTFFYAMSLGCPVFAVTTPFLAWVSSRIGHELLVLAPDLKQLCRVIAKVGMKPVSAQSLEAVEREFGDPAVRRGLALALGIKP